MQTITPFLWFDNQAEEAARFYCSVFERSSLGDIRYYGDPGPGAAGSVMSVSFELNGQRFTALNGGPVFAFTPAISFFVDCDTQEQVDYLWDQLCAGGKASQCGWLEDRYGVSWQIVPKTLGELLQDPDREKAARVMQAMLAMTKIDVGALRRAYEGR